jgi:YkoY family integral membrane protein
LDNFSAFFSHFVEPDVKTALLVVLNLILIEGLLSIDNAAVLATLVIDLPLKERKRALRIGIIFAYIFRGVSLLFASWLIKITWLKLAGGAYLLYLFISFFYKEIFSKAGEGEKVKHAPPNAPGSIPGLNNFWSTVIMVELMDMTFSIDNVFAAVAYTHNMYLIYLGVFIGIITMRIVAGYFVKLMQRFPFLDTVAFIIIGILGLRLCFEFICAQGMAMFVCDVLQSDRVDYYFSIVTVGVFFVPILTSVLFNFPKRKPAL